MRLVLPMAGYGSRLRPHTWSKPKPLVSVAGKPVLAHLLDSFEALGPLDEAVLIVGYLGEQIRDFVTDRYPQLPARFVVQDELKGQSHAIWLAREGLAGPTLIAFVDTLVEADFSSLDAEGAIWAKRVEDPRRFGVVEYDEQGMVRRLVEKPQQPVSDLAVVGFYYFPEGSGLVSAIERQMQGGSMLRGEYYLADAINLMLEDGLQMRARTVRSWHDSGTPQALLETNRYLLGHGSGNHRNLTGLDSTEIVPPVYLDPSASVRGSRLGPNLSVGPGCQIVQSQLSESIIESEAQIENSWLTNSLIGRKARVANTRGSLNIGDNAQVEGPEAEA